LCFCKIGVSAAIEKLINELGEMEIDYLCFWKIDFV